MYLYVVHFTQKMYFYNPLIKRVFFNKLVVNLNQPLNDTGKGGIFLSLDTSIKSGLFPYIY